MIGFSCVIQFLSKVGSNIEFKEDMIYLSSYLQSLYSHESNKMTTEILCLVSGVVVFIAFFAAIFTQTVTSFSLVQYLWRVIASSQVYIIEDLDRENDS